MSKRLHNSFTPRINSYQAKGFLNEVTRTKNNHKCPSNVMVTHLSGNVIALELFIRLLWPEIEQGRGKKTYLNGSL